jgi:hypothetical protein
MLVEAAWSYRYQPRVSSGKTDIVGRQPKPVRDIAWKAQVRLCSRYRKLAAPCNKRTVVITAIARELSGFVWAIGHAVRSGARRRKSADLFGRGRSARSGNPREPSGPVQSDARAKSEAGRDEKRSCGIQPANGRLIDRRHRRFAPDPTGKEDFSVAVPSARRGFSHIFLLGKGHGRAPPSRAQG